VRARQRRQLERTAYHEAGHAVAAHVLRRPFRRRTIAPDAEAGTLGLITYAPFPRDFDPANVSERRARYHLERSIITALAGNVAEAVSLARPVRLLARLNPAILRLRG
jgi:ATP-dependent Zn protease